MSTTDFYRWIQEQVQLMRSRDYDLIDWENVIEELEDVGRSEKRQLINRLAILIMHLLKWEYQPNKRSNSWKATVKEQRIRLNLILKENPSLKAKIDEFIVEAYPLAVAKAEKETGLDIFPESCPFDFENLMQQVLN
jgi:hypothetical protein